MDIKAPDRELSVSDQIQAAGIDGESRTAWYLKEWLLPPIDWRAMLRGKEWLARPVMGEG